MNIEEQIKRSIWWLAEAPAYLATSIPFMRGFVHTSDHFKIGYTKVLLASKKDFVSQYLDKKESFRVSESLINDYIENPNSVKKKIDSWSNTFTQFIDFSTLISESDIEILGTEKLKESYIDYMNRFIEVWTPALIVEANGIYSNEVLFSKFVEETGLKKARRTRFLVYSLHTNENHSWWSSV